MPIALADIQIGNCYLAEMGDAVFLVLAIDHGGKVGFQIPTGVPGGGLSFSLATMTRERFANAVVRGVPCQL
jgi:hypothetical protein